MCPFEWLTEECGHSIEHIAKNRIRGTSIVVGTQPTEYYILRSSNVEERSNYWEYLHAHTGMNEYSMQCLKGDSPLPIRPFCV